MTTTVGCTEIHNLPSMKKISCFLFLFQGSRINLSRVFFCYENYFSIQKAFCSFCSHSTAADRAILSEIQSNRLSRSISSQWKLWNVKNSQNQWLSHTPAHTNARAHTHTYTHLPVFQSVVNDNWHVNIFVSDFTSPQTLEKGPNKTFLRSGNK